MTLRGGGYIPLVGSCLKTSMYLQQTTPTTFDVVGRHIILHVYPCNA